MKALRIPPVRRERQKVFSAIEELSSKNWKELEDYSGHRNKL
jgi:hypothetical protein